MSHPVILFDGDCNLCNGAVDFILARDRCGVFRFASLQSAAAGRLLAEFGLRAANLDTIILVEASSVHVRSDAVLRIARMLRFPWSLAAIGYILPRTWRD